VATGYFGTIYPFAPSFLTTGEYRGVFATGQESGGTGKMLTLRSAGNGSPTKVRLQNLAWVSGARSTYSAEIELISSGQGLSHKITASFYNSNGAPTSDVNGIYQYSGNRPPQAFTGLGLNYKKGEVTTFNNGVVSGEAVIEESSPPVLSILEVSQEGTGYTNEDVLVVTKNEFIRVSPGAVHEGANLGIPFFTKTLTQTEGAVIDLALSNKGTETPFIQGIYNNLPVQGGEGEGLTVSAVVIGSGGSLSTIGEKSGWGLPANSSEIRTPIAVDVAGGSGEGAKVFVGLRKPVENSSDLLVPGTAPGFYTVGVAEGGVGYEATDTLEITRTAMLEAGFTLNALHEDEPLAIRGLTAPGIELSVESPGKEYVHAEGVYIHELDLINAGMALEGNTQKLHFTVYTTNAYGYAGIPTSGWSSYSSYNIAYGVNTTRWDAKNGVLAERTTWTTGDAGRPLAPERDSAPTVPTTEASITIPIRSNGYDETVEGAGPYVQQESFPVAIYYTDQAAILDAVNRYSRYLKKFMTGDYYGTSIQEGIRLPVLQNWVPNMPFRYVDAFNGKVTAMRMDASTWTVTPAGAAFTTSGIWIGESNGTLGLPSNVQVTDDASGGGFDDTTGLPYPSQNVSGTGGSGGVTGPGDEPTVEDETYVDFGDYTQIIDVYPALSISYEVEIGLPGPPTFFPVNNVFNNITTVVYLRGEIVTAGDTIDSTASGGIPSGQGNTLLTDGFTIVVEELFEPA